MVWPLLTLSLLCAAVHSLTFLQPPAHHQRKLQLDHHQRDRPFHQNNPHKPNYYERETPALPHKVPQHSPLQEQGLQHVRTLASMGNRRQFGGPEPVNASSPATALSPSPPWPSKVLGLYILLADDTEEGFTSEAEWTPRLRPWQQTASNVLFFTFIHPGTMEIPPAFQRLAASRGTDMPGAVPADTVIMFAIGGYAYSLDPNPWHWLTSRAAAEAMAERVAAWPALYGCDGVDLDLEEGAGKHKEAGPNMVHFIRKLKQLAPGIIVTQPVYGYPQVEAETDVINASWDPECDGDCGLADSLGLMVYGGTLALNYVKNYAAGSQQWQGFPIKVDAPKSVILLGAKGASRERDIVKLAQESISQDLLGIMVWYASVENGFQYTPTWDASASEEAVRGYTTAMKTFRENMASRQQEAAFPRDLCDQQPYGALKLACSELADRTGGQQEAAFPRAWRSQQPYGALRLLC